MRAQSIEEMASFSPKITERPPNPMLAALEAFPGNLAAALAAMPPPVMPPRPAGTWVVDLTRDTRGLLSKMTAKFHENK